MSSLKLLKSGAPALKAGDIITIAGLSAPRPPWYRPIKLYCWWRNPVRPLQKFVVREARNE